MSFRILLPAILLLVLFLPSRSQDLAVHGSVTDAESGEALIGVNVFSESNRLKGTTTNFDGDYEITVPAGTRLVFRYVGYRDTIIEVTVSGSLSVILQPESRNLNTVVVSASRRKEKILDAPAAISVITGEKLEKMAAVSPHDYLKNVSGLHIIKTGIQGGTPTVRGFGGFYTSNMMMLVDNRSGQVPNFRVNAFVLVPATNDDLERIEVLKGPASSLYGPNTSEGVVHMITRSPIDHQQIRLVTGVGIRSAVRDSLKISTPDNARFDTRNALKRLMGTLDFRIADTIPTKGENLKVGYKVSTSFFRGLDWKYNDPNDPEFVIKYIPSRSGNIPLNEAGEPLTAAEIASGVRGARVDNERDETVKRYSADARLDLRMDRATELILAGGFSTVSSVDMTPIGGLQQIGWKYAYVQARLLWRNLFLQGYGNFSHSGDSYYLPTGGLLIDRSKYYAAQVQHSWEPSTQLRFVYGADAFFNRANTKYTLNGKYEDIDDINEAGAYLQGDYRLHPQLTILGAARADWHSEMQKAFFSPRAAVLYKPGAGQNLRVSFNRAFRTPGVSSYFIDVRQSELPTGIGIRALGTQNEGFQYNYAANPYFANSILPQFRSPFSPDQYSYYHVGDPSLNNAGWEGILEAVQVLLPQQFGVDESNELVGQLFEQIITSLLPATIGEVGHVVRDLNATTRSFQESDWKNLRDIDGLRQVTTHSYEIGYKGLIANSVMIHMDVYRTDHFNYVAPIMFASPAVLLNADQVVSEVIPYLQDRLQDPENALYNQLLLTLLDSDPSRGGNNNGDVSDEMSFYLHQAISSLPIGTITPQQAEGAEMLLVTRNIGDVTVYGMETGMTVYLDKATRLEAFYSWVDKDSIPVPGAQFGYVALNAPRHRFSIGGSHLLEPIGLTIGARFNWQSGFPANSGNFVGRVTPYHELDVDLSWTPVGQEAFSLSLSVSNLYNNFHQHFVGSPEVGMMAVMKAAYTFR